MCSSSRRICSSRNRTSTGRGCCCYAAVCTSAADACGGSGRHRDAAAAIRKTCSNEKGSDEVCVYKVQVRRDENMAAVWPKYYFR